MKVEKLIELLETLDSDKDIYIRIDGYVWELRDEIQSRMIDCSFANSKKNAYTIGVNEQIGASF